MIAMVIAKISVLCQCFLRNIIQPFQSESEINFFWNFLSHHVFMAILFAIIIVIIWLILSAIRRKQKFHTPIIACVRGQFSSTTDTTAIRSNARFWRYVVCDYYNDYCILTTTQIWHARAQPEKAILPKRELRRARPRERHRERHLCQSQARKHNQARKYELARNLKVRLWRLVWSRNRTGSGQAVCYGNDYYYSLWY